MANGLYTKSKEGILDGSIVWTTSNVKALLVDTGSYTVDLSTHQYLSDIPAGARVSTSPLVSSRTATNGTADCADPTWSTVTGSSVEAVVFFVDTGSATSSRLIAYFDTGITGLPFTPDGGDVTLGINASGLFSL